jgi:hypothetical protein
VTLGSIIAAIISVHSPTKATTPRPIVPGIAPIRPRMSMTAIHAPAATRSKHAGADRLRHGPTVAR